MKTLNGQSILDIAIQECGSIEAIFYIAKLNDLSITDELQNGQELIVPDAINKQIASYFSQKNIKPATDVTVSNSSESLMQGLEFWAIEYDFNIN